MWPFNKKELKEKESPKQVDVERAIIVDVERAIITFTLTDDSVMVRTICGNASYITTTAYDKVRYMFINASERGFMLTKLEDKDDGTWNEEFIPLNRITSISIQYESYMIEDVRAPGIK